MKLTAATILAFVIALTSCGKSDSSNDTKADRPERSSGETLWVEGTSGFNLDAQTLTMNLDHTPEALGQTALPTCFEPLPADFMLGFALCNDNGKRFDITAGHVTQKCIVKDTVTAPSKMLSFENCKNLTIKHFEFSPELTFEVSNKSVIH